MDVANCMNKQESQAYCLAVGYRGSPERVLRLGSGGFQNGCVNVRNHFGSSVSITDTRDFEKKVLRTPLATVIAAQQW